MNDKLQIIRQQPYQQLERALKVVTKQPGLANGCALIQRPLELLQALGASAYDALDNDIKAIECMQLTIQMAASDTYEIRNALSDSLEDHYYEQPTRPPCEQGLLDLGGLVVVALAAGRVGHRLQRSNDYIDVIEATTVASLPAQAFARALNAGLDYKGLAALLSGLSHKEPQYTRLRALAPTLLNPCDAALFRCIQSLLKYVKKQIPTVGTGQKKKPREWDGAISEVIASIQPENEDKLLVTLKDDWFDNTNTSDVQPKFDRVVFVSPSQETSTSIEQDIPDSEDHLSFSISIPTEARAGWIGLQSEDMRKKLIQHRNKLVTSLDIQNTDHACLRDKGIPIKHLRTTSPIPTAPQFNAAAAWGVRILDIELAQNDNGGVQIIVTLSKPDRTRRVHLHLIDAQQNVFDPDLDLDDKRSTASGEIPAEYISPYSGKVELFVRDDEHPDDVKKIEYDTISHAPPPEDAFSDGDIITPETLGMVILRPAFVRESDDPVDQPMMAHNSPRIDRVIKQQAIEAFNTTKAVLGNRLDIHEFTLPWIADSEQTITSEVPNMDGPASTKLAEHLDRLATLTVGCEDHVFVSLIPKTDAHSTFLKVIRSEAARALVICTPDRLTEATKIAAKTTASVHKRTTTNRLRITGHLRNGKVTLTEPARVETRAVGTGGDYLTGIVAVGYRADGSKVLSQRLRTVNASRNGHFMSLLPVNHEITSIQLLYKPDLFAVELKAVPEIVEAILTNVTGNTTRYNLEGLVKRRITPTRHGSLPSLYQPPGEPYIEITELNTNKISWRYGHTRGIRPRVEIELRFGDIWRRVYSALEGSTSAEVEFTRLAPGLQIDGLRVVASDGWNTMIEEKDAAELEASFGYDLKGAAAIIRHAGELQYWFDTDRDTDDTVTWSFADENGEPEQEIRKLPAGSIFDINAEHIGKDIVAKSGETTSKPIKVIKKSIAYRKNTLLRLHRTNSLR